MFHFFGMKKGNVVVKDKIWLSKLFKWQACLNEVLKNKTTIIAVWFEDSYQELQTFFLKNNISSEGIFLCRELARHHFLNNQIIFAEHYPLVIKEKELFEKLGLANVTIYSSLDEPLFIHFGGDKISGLVKQMGMKDDEVIEHSFITASIKNAQDKIGEKIVIDQSANSQADWFRKNLNSQIT